MKAQTENYLNSNLRNAALISFGVKRQFIELTFSSEEYEEICFFFDCDVKASDGHELDNVISLLKGYDRDVFEIAYFIKANNQKIELCEITVSGDLRVRFSNGYEIWFIVSSSTDHELDITFKVRENSCEYSYVHLESGQQWFNKVGKTT